MQQAGSVRAGSKVTAQREAGDEWEPAVVQAFDAAAGTLSLTFEGGFVRKAVPISQVRFDAGPVAAAAAAPSPTSEGAAPADEYSAAVKPGLPKPPSVETQKQDPEAKYHYVAALKDAGNALFKQGKFAWAIRTYREAVESLARNCYPSKERMLWDYLARVPCAQCYSNAALCALKLPDYALASSLCELAMECRPEDTDLVKILLRHGQAKLGLRDAEAARELLERAADKDPANRAVREELAKAKKLIAAALRDADQRLFKGVDLSRSGLTSKREHAEQGHKSTIDSGFEALADSKDDAALECFAPLLGQLAGAARRPLLLQVAYGVGIAYYHKSRLAESVSALQQFFALQQELAAEGVETSEPPLGLPLARFYLAHASFNTQQPGAKIHLLAYLEDVKAAGPQKVLNMPDGWNGKKITEMDRKASRFRARACSGEAQADAHTMLGMIAEQQGGPSAALPHCQACVELAGPDGQKLTALESLARVYAALEDHEKEAETTRAAEALQEKMRLKEAEEAEKQAKEAEQAAAPVEDESEAQSEAAQGEEGVAAGHAAEEEGEEASGAPA